MIISIDFDGTIVSNKFPAIGEMMPDAARVVINLKNDGHVIIINTCRCGDELTDAINFLLASGIPFDRINDNALCHSSKFPTNSRKVYADCYIDDHNLGGLPKWTEIYQTITQQELEQRNSLKK